MNPSIRIRIEQTQDHSAVEELVEAAFRNEEFSDHQEHQLVNRLRQSNAFIADLSLVAENEQGEIIGHILLTELTIGDKHPSLALAPVSVLPQYQKQGVGSQLIKAAHHVATHLGYGSVIVLGHADYYPHFGYKPLSQFGLRMPFEAPGECCMAIELQPSALDGVHGMVIYPAEFFE